MQVVVPDFYSVSEPTYYEDYEDVRSLTEARGAKEKIILDNALTGLGAMCMGPTVMKIETNEYRFGTPDTTIVISVSSELELESK
jgi:hypothetical protein